MALISILILQVGLNPLGLIGIAHGGVSQSATLTVIKHVDGGTAVPSDFTMTITGVTATGGNLVTGTESPGITKTTTVGPYTVTEPPAPGYTTAFSADCAGTLANGDAKTCTVINVFTGEDSLPTGTTITTGPTNFPPSIKSLMTKVLTNPGPQTITFPNPDGSISSLWVTVTTHVHGAHLSFKANGITYDIAILPNSNTFITFLSPLVVTDVKVSISGRDFSDDAIDLDYDPAVVQCWDLNENAVKDIPPFFGFFIDNQLIPDNLSEDVNGDGIVNYLDCPFQDTDGDGLLDDWEISGIDVNGDGQIDLNLAALGANPYHKDIFVEVDYMQFHQPRANAINDVVMAFANAPVTNPDGVNGINLHVQVDEQVPHTDNLFPVWIAFDTIKNQHFGTATQRTNPNHSNILDAKRLVYHYSLFAHQYDFGGSSGTAEMDLNLLGIPEAGGNDFIVSLGAAGWGLNDAGTHTIGTRDQQAGSFMHEFGHNLGLGHGGGDSTNYKPNYLSIMNYAFQITFRGIGNPLDYSHSVLPTLNEFNLNEPAGVGASTPPGLKTINYHCGGTFSTGIPVDWNCDGDRVDLGVIAEINKDPLPLDSSLVGFDDWNSLKYNFRTSTGYADGVHPDHTSIQPEMTPRDEAELISTIGLHVDIDVKPGSLINPINRESKGVTPVAILGETTFDVKTIDSSSIRFGPNLSPVIKSSFLDVNGDGELDLVLHFGTQQTGIACGQTSVTLTGYLVTGEPIEGTDKVTVLPCK